MVDASSVSRTLINLGLSPVASAALAARAGPESGYNPTAIGDNGTSYGLWQMHGPRYAALMDFAKAGGMDPADPTTQAKYVLSELGGSEKAAGNALRAATTPEQATAAVMAFERPKGYSATNPMGGLGSAATLAATRALLSGGALPSSAQGQPAPAATMAAPAPTDPDPLQQVAAVKAPALAPQAAPTSNLGFGGGGPDPGEQAQQAAGLLAQFMAQGGGVAGVPAAAPIGRIPSILGRRVG